MNESQAYGKAIWGTAESLALRDGITIIEALKRYLGVDVANMAPAIKLSCQREAAFRRSKWQSTK